MFEMLKSIVWMAGILVIGYFVMHWMGYEINNEYFHSTKNKCQEKMNECSQTLLHKGIDNIDLCKFDCIDPQLIIKK